MRQCKRQGCSLDAIDVVDLTVTEVDLVSPYTSDGDVTFASVFSPGALTSDS